MFYVENFDNYLSAGHRFNCVGCGANAPAAGKDVLRLRRGFAAL